ncbi:hypothetical protein SS50377_24274 [Spironucleus salmonicida]|uniref:Uncharacterized protein n=1 Tax=Spironucleus salmonicida TaxID=348837 RepID=V6LJP4_9EUKA|nr:hypothetical protein SS50377_24274 [Spironucleus salmonicida]|eukprot:EST44815.1 Hypothetical protein SS50377_15260 [Spironucleus salmonicida]
MLTSQSISRPRAMRAIKTARGMRQPLVISPAAREKRPGTSIGSAQRCDFSSIKSVEKRLQQEQIVRKKEQKLVKLEVEIHYLEAKIASCSLPSLQTTAASDAAHLSCLRQNLVTANAGIYAHISREIALLHQRLRASALINTVLGRNSELHPTIDPSKFEHLNHEFHRFALERKIEIDSKFIEIAETCINSGQNVTLPSCYTRKIDPPDIPQAPTYLFRVIEDILQRAKFSPKLDKTAEEVAAMLADWDAKNKQRFEHQILPIFGDFEDAPERVQQLKQAARQLENQIAIRKRQILEIEAERGVLDGNFAKFDVFQAALSRVLGIQNREAGVFDAFQRLEFRVDALAQSLRGIAAKGLLGAEKVLKLRLREYTQLESEGKNAKKTAKISQQKRVEMSGRKVMRYEPARGQRIKQTEIAEREKQRKAALAIADDESDFYV